MVLKNLVHVGGEEVVKFLQVMMSLCYYIYRLKLHPQDTLDCLFEILNDNHEKFRELVFEALVNFPSSLHSDNFSFCRCPYLV